MRTLLERQRQRRLLERIALAACAACAACSAPPTASVASSGLQRGEQRDTAASPLWTTRYVAPADPNAGPGSVVGLAVGAADVDDSGSTFVFAKVRTRNPDFQSNAVYVFDADGALLLRSSNVGNTQAPAQMRVNSAGGYIGELSGGATPPTVSLLQNGAALFARSGTGHAADICGDGSSVLVFRPWSQTPPATTLISFDASGGTRWSVDVPGNLELVDKVRCLGDERIVMAGTAPPRIGAGEVAAAAQFDSTGALDWTWTGTDPVVEPLGFDVDSRGDVYLATNAAMTNAAPGSAASPSGQLQLYAIDTAGKPLASWKSGGTSDSFRSISVSDVVAVAGGGHAAVYDLGGNPIWRRDDVGGDLVALDGADELLVCGASTGLYGADGSLQWTYDSSWLSSPTRADVTNAVGRCIGSTSDGIGIVAFQVR